MDEINENKKEFEPFPGTVYSDGKPVNMPYEEEKEKKEEKSGRKKKIPLILLSVLLCAVISAGTSALTSFLILKRVSVPASGETSESTAAETEPIIFEEPETVLVTEPLTEETTEAETEPATTAAPVPETTTAAPVKSKTKSQIYKESVNSVVGITSLYNREFRGLLGSTYTRQYGSTGSGFFISSDGYIVTNYHVVENGTDITVSTFSGETYKARTVGYDAANDIAVLKIDATGQSVWIGDSSAMSVGDDIMVIGNALGSLSYTFTDGVISYKNRIVAVDGNQKINMFQTNAAINNGNSGGPVYNMDGEVIGIASAKFSSESIEGLCFFIPINDVTEKIGNIVENGS